MTSTERAMYDFWGKWFAQPLEEKMEYLRQPGKGGYYPAGSEGPGLKGGRDVAKEYFHWRIEAQHPDASAGSATRKVFLNCLEKADQWCYDLELDQLTAHVRTRDCVLRIIHYLPNPEPLVGEAHRDFDLLTVSVEGTAPGLEIWDPSFRWKIPQPDGAWTLQETGIQVGEMLELYVGANDVNEFSHFQATTHRVRTEPNTDRLKAVFFYLPPNDFELRPGFTAGDYLKDVLSKAGTYGIGAK